MSITDRIYLFLADGTPQYNQLTNIVGKLPSYYTPTPCKVAQPEPVVEPVVHKRVPTLYEEYLCL